MRPMQALAALIAALALSGSAAAADTVDRVNIRSGDLQGVIQGDVVKFLAIPYAAPPVGDLRWRAPQPPAAWPGVRQANQVGAACMQTPGLSSYQGPESEDCLTLNVWAPARRPAGELPVMVWIHGGGFIGGTGGRYDGSHFAEDGVVLVTVNYRLGRLGFFAHPALARSNPEGALANFALMDQAAALKWVKDNIAAFGGDPANVTVFGESAGGMSVNYLMISPRTRGLFARAISESGFGRAGGTPLSQAQAFGVTFMQAQGITGEGPEAVRAMRALPASALTKPAGGLTDPNAPGPITDGVFAAETVAEAFAKGGQARVPFMVGGNSFEASLFGAALHNPEAILGRLGDKRDAAVQLFGQGDPVKAAANIVTFSQMIEPDRYLTRQQAAAGAPAYLYYFSYVPEAIRSQTIGAGHGAEVAYVFDTLPKTPFTRPASDTRLGPTEIPAATPADEAIARSIHAYWVAFPKTGDPGAAGGPAWPALTTTDDVLLEFGAGGVTARRHFEALELDLLEKRAATGQTRPAGF